MSPHDISLAPLVGREVVIDIASPYVILGRLSAFDDHFLLVEQADVHDLRDTTTTRENYLVDSRRHGIRINRRRVLVARREVVCLSRLDEVVG
ncbi:MAG: hypothetical protein ACK50P_17435 [Planctomycetaceae bacterium]|jgi:hypothetical protein